MYKIVEAGEIESFNNYVSLAAKIILALNKKNIETDRTTISKIFPIFRDLFPVFNFLKKNNKEITFTKMVVQNSLLENYNSNLSGWSNKTNVANIIGKNLTTLKGYIVTDRTIIDKLLDNYPDGRPELANYDDGDGTVLAANNNIGNTTMLNLDHNELISKESGIKQILNSIGLSYFESQIVEGRATTIGPSLLFLIKSPAEMSVTYKQEIYPEQDGQIFIENAGDGDYQLNIKGLSPGNYEVIMAQIGKNNDVWDHIYGQITKNPPNLQTDVLNIHYDSSSPKSYFETNTDLTSLFNDLINYLQINKKNNSIVNRLIGIKNTYLKYKKNKKYDKGLSSVKREIIENQDFIALEKIENIQTKISDHEHRICSSNQFRSLENKINRLDKAVNQAVLVEINKRLELVKNNNCKKVYIYEDSINELVKNLYK